MITNIGVPIARKARVVCHWGSLPLLEAMYPFDSKDVDEHFQRVCHEVYFRAGLVDPVDRDFLDSIAKPGRDEEDLHVEGEVVQSLPRKNVSHHLAAKQLESALGIGKTGHGNYVHEAREYPSNQSATQRSN